MLLFDNAGMSQISDLIALASLNPIDAMAAQNLDAEALRRHKMKLMAFTIALPVDYLITYTHEIHVDTMCRHIAISNSPGTVPTPATLALFCQAFKMVAAGEMLMDICNKQPPRRPHAILQFWTEKFANGRIAVNILAPLQES